MSDLAIHAALSARVAVLPSPDVDQCVKLNGLADFAQLLAPFQESATKVTVHTSQLEKRVCDHFPLHFDPYSLYNPHAQPEKPGLVNPKGELLDQVNQLISTNIKTWHAQAEADQAVTPWFTAVRDLLFRQRHISRHETFGHPVCVLVAVSSASPDPMNDFAKLYEIAGQSSPFPAHPYINPDTLKYYVLLHDVRTSGAELKGSVEVLEEVKKTYGLHCCLLVINSADPDSATDSELAALWNSQSPSTAQCLDVEDIKRIKNFVRELTVQSIVPFMERYVQHMSEQLSQSRKNLTNRFFGASRKLFGVSTTTSKGTAATAGYNAQYDFYLYNTMEAQTRRLADFAFTIRDYKLAASMYDIGRKDFANDKAVRHAAGATEMFGLSHLLIMHTSQTAPIDVDSYLAQACRDYNSRPISAEAQPVADENNALRATLLYYEAYRALDYLRPAPSGLLRIAQVSEEVLSPLLLEQAAIACVGQKPRPAMRKHALYLVMAAHRYQACGQKLLSLRCYAQAAEVYREKGWTLIENHIEHELGTQAYNEGNSRLAVQHLLQLIRPSTNSSAEHDAFLKAVQTAHKYSDAESSNSSTPLRLPHPLFDAKASTVRIVSDVSTSADDATWRNLEAQLFEVGLKDRVLADGSVRKRKRPVTSTSNQTREVPVHQTFWLDLVVRNPLAIELAIDQLMPKFATSASEDLSLVDDSDVQVELSERIVLAPRERRLISLGVKIVVPVEAARLWAIAFQMADSIPCLDVLHKTGKRLNTTAQHRQGTVHAPDTTLMVSVYGARPTLTARILDPPASLMQGEVKVITVLLKNEGSGTVDDICALCSQPEAVTFDASDMQATVANDLHVSPPDSVYEGKSLAPGQEVQVKATIRATRQGQLSLAWLISFCAEGGSTYLTRLALFTHVLPGLEVVVQCTPCAGAECQYDVTIQASNLSPRSMMYVDALTLLSPSWTSVHPADEMGEVAIHALQSWRTTLRIARHDSEPSDLYQHTVTKLQDLLLSRDTKRPAAPSLTLQRSNVPSRSSRGINGQLYREARRKWRLRMLAEEFPTIAARDRNETFALYEAPDLDVIVDYHSDDGMLGQTQVYGLQPGPIRNRLGAITNPSADAAGTGIRSMYAQTAKELASLLTNILHSRLATDENPVTISTTVQQEEGCEFTLRNLSDRYTTQVVLHGSWLGRSTLRATLPPNTAQSVHAVPAGNSSGYSCTVVCLNEDGQAVCRFAQ